MPFTANHVKGKIQWYYEQARDTAADIELVLLKWTGLEGDDALADYTNLAALLAASNDEADFTGTNGGSYVRKTLPSPTVSTDNVGNRNLLGGAAVGTPVLVTWSNAGNTTTHRCGKYLVVFVPAPGTSTDAQRVVLQGHDIDTTPDGNDLVVTSHADGYLRYRVP